MIFLGTARAYGEGAEKMIKTIACSSRAPQQIRQLRWLRFFMPALSEVAIKKTFSIYPLRIVNRKCGYRKLNYPNCRIRKFMLNPFFQRLIKNSFYVQLRGNHSVILRVYLTIALFTVSFSHLHYNVKQRGCEAISG